MNGAGAGAGGSQEERETNQDGKVLSLKITRDGLSTSWAPFRTVAPFYSGGKVEFFNGASQLACILESQLCLVDMTTSNKVAKEIQSLIDGTSEITDEITCFCVAPNGRNIVTASRNLLLRHWNLQNTSTNNQQESDESCNVSWVCVRSIKGHRMPVLAMAYDSSSTLVATGSADRIVRVWDIPRGHCTHSFKQHTDIVPYVTFHPDPHKFLLFSASDDSTLKIYDLMESKCVADFREHMSRATSITFSEDGYTAASVGRDKVINFYDLRTMSHIKTLAVMEELEACFILPREQSQALLCGSSDRGSGGEGEAPRGGRKRKLSVDHTTHVLVVGGDRGILRFYKFSIQPHEISSFHCEPLFLVNTASGRTLQSSEVVTSHFGVKSIIFLSATRQLCVTAADNAIIYFNINAAGSSKDTLVTKDAQLMGSFDEILDVVVLRDVADDDDNSSCEPSERPVRVAVVSNSPHVQILDSRSESVNLLGHTDVVLSVSASPDGKWLVTSSKDRTCRMWDVQTCACVGVAEGHGDAVGCVALSQRTSTYTSKLACFVSGGSDKVLKRWSVNPVLQFDHLASSATVTSQSSVRLTASHSVRAHEKDINTVAIAPNDSMVASGSQDTKIRLWTAIDLTPIATLSGHKRSVWRVCFSPVDKCLASSSGDRTVKLWSLTDYSCLRTFQGHSASVLCVKFVNNGMQLMSGASDGLINLWTIRTGELQNTFDHHKDKVWNIDVVSDSTTQDDSGVFVSVGGDSNLIFWSDCTVHEENMRIKAIEDKMLLDQKLGNDIRGKRYKQALRSALQLKYPIKVLEIFRAILEDNEMKLFRKNILFSFEDIQLVFDEYVCVWSSEDLVQVLTYTKEWNTNARNSYIVNVLLASVIRLVGVEELIKLPALAEVLRGVAAYSDRHFQRLDRLHEATYLLEFINSEMSVVHGTAVSVEDDGS